MNFKTRVVIERRKPKAWADERYCILDKFRPGVTLKDVQEWIIAEHVANGPRMEPLRVCFGDPETVVDFEVKDADDPKAIWHLHTRLRGPNAKPFAEAVVESIGSCDGMPVSSEMFDEAMKKLILGQSITTEPTPAVSHMNAEEPKPFQVFKGATKKEDMDVHAAVAKQAFSDLLPTPRPAYEWLDGMPCETANPDQLRKDLGFAPPRDGLYGLPAKVRDLPLITDDDDKYTKLLLQPPMQVLTGRAMRRDPLVSMYWTHWQQGEFKSFEDMLLRLAVALWCDRARLLDQALASDVIVFNYPDGDAQARALAEEQAAKIKGRIAFARPRDPKGDWPAVEQVARSSMAPGPEDKK